MNDSELICYADIDVTKIKKSDIKEIKRKSGEIAKIIKIKIVKKESQYSDGFISQLLSDPDNRSEIIGNIRMPDYFDKNKKQNHKNSEWTPPAPDTDEMPF